MLYTRLVISLLAIIIDDNDCVVLVELIDNIIQLNENHGKYSVARVWTEQPV